MKRTITITIAIFLITALAMPAIAGMSRTQGNSTYYYNNQNQLTGIANRNGSITTYDTFNPRTGAVNAPGDRPW